MSRMSDSEFWDVVFLQVLAGLPANDLDRIAEAKQQADDSVAARRLVINHNRRDVLSSMPGVE